MARCKTSVGDRDYIYQNAVATKLASVTARSRRFSGDEGEESKRWLQKQGFGRVPAYLQSWKAVLAEQHAINQSKKLESLVPAGMRIMPENERLNMLEMLQRGERDVEMRIQSQPLVIETPSQKQVSAHLLQRMSEIQEAITLFSKTTVLVEK